MRTTLSLDHDVAQSIETLRKRHNLSLRDVIDQLLRAGLESLENRPKARAYSVPVFNATLLPGIDANRMNQLADELEAEHFRP